MNDFLSLLNKWNQDNEYQKIIDCLEKLSNTQKLDYTLTCQLARAYNNIADLDKEESKSQLERAEELLRSVADYRMVAYSLALVLMMIFRPKGLLGSYDFSMSRLLEKALNTLFHRNAKTEKGGGAQ